MTDTATTDTPTTSITMVLDRSGSMATCRSATIAAVNTYLAEARTSDLKSADFELTIFDSTSIDTIRSGVLSEVADISKADFQPRDMTPLWDACGRAIDSLDTRAGDGKAILVIVTDGAENHSRKHTALSIRELIEARQAKGWLVIFLGAGLDNALQGRAMGISAENIANIGLDEASLGATMDAMATTNAAYASTSSMAEAKAYAASPKFSRRLRMAMGDASGGDGIVNSNAQPAQRPRGKAMKPKADGDGDTWATTPGDAWGD